MILKKGNPQLEAFIQDEIKELQIQSQKANAIPYFIEIQNRRLEKLVTINNGIILLDRPQVWQYVEACIQKVESINSGISGHLIDLNVNYKRLNFSHVKVPEELL